MRRRFIVISLQALLLFCTYSFEAYAQGTIEQILSSGETDKRINIVFLSEGYTQSQLPRYLNDAKNMLASLLSTQPYAEYRNFFNAYAISIASQDSGSDHPSANVYRNTYFNSTFEAGGIARLIGIDYTGYQRANDLLQDLMPEYDHAIMIVNDSVYGGSGGEIALTSVHPASPQVVIHEFGHSMAFLADEYPDAIPNPPDIEKPNATQETRRNFIKWNIWIDNQTPIPTPQTNQYNSVIGLFEGANYRTAGWYRPKLSCKMRSLGSPFCEVCEEAIVISIYSILRPVESYQPQNGTLLIQDTSIYKIILELMKPFSHSYFIEWFVDGKRDSTSGQNELIIHSVKMGEGIHTVEVNVTDTTSMVRNDPLSYTKQYVRWYVMIQRPTNVDSLSKFRESNRTMLLNNYPNPFRDQTAVNYILPSFGHVQLTVYDMLGRKSATLVDEEQEAGFHTASFHASTLPFGVYQYTIKAGSFVQTKRMVLMK